MSRQPSVFEQHVRIQGRQQTSVNAFVRFCTIMPSVHCAVCLAIHYPDEMYE
ncbi:hypothetical protein GGI12_005572, partial [Dipsacomyces acuminosporus]